LLGSPIVRGRGRQVKQIIYKNDIFYLFSFVEILGKVTRSESSGSAAPGATLTAAEDCLPLAGPVVVYGQASGVHFGGGKSYFPGFLLADEKPPIVRCYFGPDAFPQFAQVGSSSFERSLP
jgi:hypothetical protein